MIQLGCEYACCFDPLIASPNAYCALGPIASSGHRWSEHTESREFCRNLRTAWAAPVGLTASPGPDVDCLHVRRRTFVWPDAPPVGSSDAALASAGTENPPLPWALLEVVRRRTAALETSDTVAGAGGSIALLTVRHPHAI